MIDVLAYELKYKSDPMVMELLEAFKRANETAEYHEDGDD